MHHIKKTTILSDVNSQSRDFHFQKFFRLIKNGHFFCPFFSGQKNF
jgi:hypothetical protein